MQEIEKILDYSFKQKGLLKHAITHPSVAGNKPMSCNDFERLEFLGDRVLGLVVSALLYRHYPKEAEGDLSQRLSVLVSRDMCDTICTETNLCSFVNFRQSDSASINSYVMANALESIIGAIFLDGGLEPCTRFIERIWTPLLGAAPQKDPKSTLHETLAQQGLEAPVYNIVERTGPDHAPMFTLEVIAHNKKARGTGSSRKIAEQNAARALLDILDF